VTKEILPVEETIHSKALQSTPMSMKNSEVDGVLNRLREDSNGTTETNGSFVTKPFTNISTAKKEEKRTSRNI
jgi:hypothetical protein